jgi:hypothetical protein
MYGRFIDDCRCTRISGENSFTFDATGLTPGIYFVHMKSGDAIADSKMVVVK